MYKTQQGQVFGPRQVTQHGSEQLHSTPCSQNWSDLIQTALWELLVAHDTPKKCLDRRVPLTFTAPCPMPPAPSAQAGAQHHSRDESKRRTRGKGEGALHPQVDKRAETFAQGADWQVWEETEA